MKQKSLAFAMCDWRRQFVFLSESNLHLCDFCECATRFVVWGLLQLDKNGFLEQ